MKFYFDRLENFGFDRICYSEISHNVPSVEFVPFHKSILSSYIKNVRLPQGLFFT